MHLHVQKQYILKPLGKKPRDELSFTCTALPLVLIFTTRLPSAIQVSSPDVAEPSKRSVAFWKKTKELMNEVEELQRDTRAIICPCNKPDCPFRTENGRCSPSTQSFTHLNWRDSSNDTPARKFGAYNGFANLNEECESDLDGNLSDGDYTFSRNVPSRKTRRKHTSFSQTSLKFLRDRSTHLLALPSQPSYSYRSLSERTASLPSVAGFYFY